jgi:hypothetical protein
LLPSLPYLYSRFCKYPSSIHMVCERSLCSAELMAPIPLFAKLADCHYNQRENANRFHDHCHTLGSLFGNLQTSPSTGF